MPTFTYEALERSGSRTRGKITATNKVVAVNELKQQGLLVSAIKEEKLTFLHKEIVLGRPVKHKHFTVFLRQFATLIRAGIGLVDSIRILAKQSESKNLGKALSEIETDLRRGIQLSEACIKHPKIFDPLFISMIKAGEASGNMELILDRLAGFYERSHFTREKVKAAMTYPITVGLIAVAVTMFLLTYIVPTFVTMFASFQAELPLITRMVMAVSNSLVDTWYLYVLGIAAIVIGWRITADTPKGRYAIDYALLKFPIFGKLLQKSAVARMTRTLSTLFASTVPILQALTIVEGVVGNKVMGQAIHDAQDSLRQGRSLSEPLKKTWVFPPLVSHMLSVGEETGSLDLMLTKVADFYEAEVETAVDQIKALIEPIMIVILAVLVGVIVLAIMVPMFEIFSKVQ
ncbi:type II secretion system F family protein [Brevibacillus dissolubilis]|uniref:type II secretion system F family protein n=1 Tax=Brevibacillus dissolubilis TaxID=1844116 RepID=UPI0011174573|nr:type II secretion system F family protein [Brevibacillus dissolubilis]